MAFTTESITPGLIGIGPVILTVNSVNKGRVTDFSIDTASGRYEIMGGSLQQLIDVIKTSRASGKVTVTLDEIPDIDSTGLVGLQSSIVLTQELPAGAAVAWEFACDSAYIRVLSVAGTRNATPSTVKLEIIPVGSTGWTFDNAVSTA